MVFDICVVALCAVAVGGGVVWLAAVRSPKRRGKVALGTVVVRVRGALNVNHRGRASFGILETAVGRVWVINLSNSWSRNSFQLSLSALQDGENYPARGDYEIGPSASESSGNRPVFLAMYSSVFDEGSLHVSEYGTLGKGVLTIEVSDERGVNGNFRFTAVAHAPTSMVSAVIEVGGEFAAKNRV